MHVLVTWQIDIKTIGSKATEKRWRHHFPHYKTKGVLCCHGNQSFYPICLTTLCSLSPTPVMLHIKFDQDWPTGFRYIQVQKCEMFVTQGQVTPKWVVWFELNRAFMPVLVTSNFDDDSIKNEWASMVTAFSHYKSMGNILDAQGQLTP